MDGGEGAAFISLGLHSTKYKHCMYVRTYSTVRISRLIKLSYHDNRINGAESQGPIGPGGGDIDGREKERERKTEKNGRRLGIGWRSGSKRENACCVQRRKEISSFKA